MSNTDYGMTVEDARTALGDLPELPKALHDIHTIVVQLEDDKPVVWLQGEDQHGAKAYSYDRRYGHRWIGRDPGWSHR